ncbi:MAG: TIGR01777 family oxidoreductase [Candidatus Eiseniibacteriota bacterium]
MRVLVSGSSGLVGAALARELARGGHEVGRLLRGGAGASTGEGVAWDPRAGVDPAALSGWDAVVHLAGKNLACLWTPAAQHEIRRSRVEGTRRLAEALARAEDGPRTLLCASGVGWYGSRGEEALDEDSTPGTGWLGDLCREWEAAADPARSAGLRVAHLRFGIVLAREGGALAKMLPPFRLGLGGRIGGGRQWMSWVTRDDAVRAALFALEAKDLAGPLNVVAPQPVTNADFTAALGRALGRPTPFPVPAFLLSVLPGGMAKEMLLASQRASPARLTGRGFMFRHARLDAALDGLLREAPQN